MTTLKEHLENGWKIVFQSHVEAAVEEEIKNMVLHDPFQLYDVEKFCEEGLHYVLVRKRKQR